MEKTRIILIIISALPMLGFGVQILYNAYLLVVKNDTSKKRLTAIGKDFIGMSLAGTGIILFYFLICYFAHYAIKLDLLLKSFASLGLPAIAGAILVSFNRLDDENSNKE